MQKSSPKKFLRKPQQQDRPGMEYKMKPMPVDELPQQNHRPKLAGKTALITGGDSGIGRAVAILFAKEGANIAISYLSESKDARETKTAIEQHGAQCLLIKGDIRTERNCKKIVSATLKYFKHIDILVNNAAIHYENKSIKDITNKQLIRTFTTNVFSMFWITQAAVPHMKKGSCIINTSSVTAYRGSPSLIDYASSKGAIVAFTRSLSANLVKKGIRVNGVAPGPIWTPLIPSSFKRKKVAQHGSDTPMTRAGEPVEVAPCYLFLASEDGSYMTGQFLHPNGGEIVNG